MKLCKIVFSPTGGTKKVASFVADALEGEEIYVGVGSACSSHKQKVSRTLRAMGVPPRYAESALRFSLCPENTLEEMERVAQAAARHYRVLSKFQRR